jgi:hypothetical protein
MDMGERFFERTCLRLPERDFEPLPLSVFDASLKCALCFPHRPAELADVRLLDGVVDSQFCELVDTVSRACEIRVELFEIPRQTAEEVETLTGRRVRERAGSRGDARAYLTGVKRPVGGTARSQTRLVRQASDGHEQHTRREEDQEEFFLSCFHGTWFMSSRM